MIKFSNPTKASLIAFFVIISISMYGIRNTAMFMVVLISGLFLYRIWLKQPTI